MKKFLTRVAFCPFCFADKRPDDGDYFTVIGTRHKPIKHRYDPPRFFWDRSPKGFTPHFFNVHRQNADGTLEVSLTCAMHECGISAHKQGEKFDCLRTQVVVITVQEWKALESFTDTGYKL
jgi:hypothetical protein